MQEKLCPSVRRGRRAGIAVAWLVLLAGQAAMAAPVTLTCTFANSISASGSGGGTGKRQWVYDVQAQTVDGHRVGETIDIKDGAYNRYFITDTAIGFATSSGVRHTVSRVDGSYTAFDANGKLNWRGQCVPAN